MERTNSHLKFYTFPLLRVSDMLLEFAVCFGAAIAVADFPNASVSTACDVALALQVEVADVINLESDDSIKYALRTQLQTDGYEVV